MRYTAFCYRVPDAQRFGTLIVVEAGWLSLTSLHCLASHGTNQLATSLTSGDPEPTAPFSWPISLPSAQIAFGPYHMIIAEDVFRLPLP